MFNGAIFRTSSGLNKEVINSVFSVAYQARTGNIGVKIEKFRVRLVVGKHSFSTRVPDLWNRFPDAEGGAGT